MNNLRRKRGNIRNLTANNTIAFYAKHYFIVEEIRSFFYDNLYYILAILFFKLNSTTVQ